MARRCNPAFCLALVALLNIGLAVGDTRTTNESNDLISQVIAPADESDQEDSKEKRSREEIMFGNQQNKPNGLVDDMMGENADDDSFISSVVVPEKKDVNDTTKDESTPESTPKAKEEVDPKEKRTPDQQEPQEEPLMMPDSDVGNWYRNGNPQVTNIQYLGNPTMQRIPLDDNYNNLYDQEDLYRRKRQLGHPLPLRKRSLRSPLGQMIQTRGRRLPRRSMRLKRQVDVEDLLSLLGDMDNDRGRYYEPQQQVPSRMNNLGYSEKDYGFPYSYIRRVDLPDPDNMNNGMNNNMDDGMSDIDSLMLMPPNSRYVEGPDLGMPYRSREDENEAIQKWLTKHTTPSGSVFSMSRRSAPVFYPVDYRYMSGYKKRSRMGNSNHRMGEDDQDMGQWGQVVAIPEAYASAEDVARLYALANLMAEGEEEPQKMRRSA